jgi:hypothetical protein
MTCQLLGSVGQAQFESLLHPELAEEGVVSPSPPEMISLPLSEPSDSPGQVAIDPRYHVRFDAPAV